VVGSSLIESPQRPSTRLPTKEGWLEGAKMFWLLPAGLAVAIAIIFFLAFWDKSSAATGGAEETPDSDALSGEPASA
ncbi:MAG: hypothetical protein AAFX06_33110, partial [Planctomycetota bacterium]